MPRSTVGNNALKTNAKCKNWKKLGYKNSSQCRGSIRADTQKAGTSAKREQDKVGGDIAKSKNVRMKNRLKKQAISDSRGY